MKIALIQMTVGQNKAENLQRASSLALKAKGADVIMLPEMFCCPYENEAFSKNSEREGTMVCEMLAQTAKACGEYFVRHSSRQRYCSNPNCQAERNNRKARAYYQRKKAD